MELYVHREEGQGTSPENKNEEVSNRNKIRSLRLPNKTIPQSNESTHKARLK